MADSSKTSSKTQPSSDLINRQNGSAPPANRIKAPTFITEQVIVGLLNDVFSSCVFRSIPKIKDEPLSLTGSDEESENKYYMLSLKWTKKNTLVQSISHNFSIFDPEASFAKDDPCKYSKGSLISVGLFTSLELSLKEPCDGFKIPISIIKNYIDKEINKGGYWAYMSSPVFLSPNANDAGLKEQKERRSKILKLAKEELDIISPTVIICLLWSIYYTNSHKKLKDVCTVLCYEFLENYHKYKKFLVYLLYLAQKTEVLTNDQLEKMINAKFNSVNILENLTVQDIVILTNIVDYHQSKSTICQKLGSLLYHHVEDMSKECAVYLLTGLLKLNFPFNQNDLFTKVLLNKITNVYKNIDSSDTIENLFNTLSIMPYPVLGYLNQMISKTLNRLHRLSVKDVGRIGSSYATGNITSEMLDIVDKSVEIKNLIDGILVKPLSKHIYHCLEFKFRNSAINYRGKELDLLTMINECIIHNLQFEFPVELNKKRFKYDHNWMDAYSAVKILDCNVNETLADAWELEAQANNPAYSKTYTFFFLNLLDDCFKNEEFLDEALIEQIVFSFLTLKIDLGLIHEKMMTSKGESIKKAGGFVEIKIVESPENMKTQYKMAKEILSWSRTKEGKNGVVKIGGIKIDEDSFEILERDNKLPEIRKQRSVTINNLQQEQFKTREGKTVRSPPPEKKVKREDSIELEREIPIKRNLGKVIRSPPSEKKNTNKGDRSPTPESKVVQVETIKRSQGKTTRSPPPEKKLKRKDGIELERETSSEHIKGKNKRNEPVNEKSDKKSSASEPTGKEKKEIDDHIKGLIKLAEKIPKSSFVVGNPIYDVLRFYGLENLDGDVDFNKSKSKSKSGDLSGSVYVDDSKVLSSKHKGGRSSKESSSRSDISKDESWVDVSKVYRRPSSKVSSSKKLKKTSEVIKEHYDIFFKIITTKKSKIKLEKRKILIKYQYIKKRR